MSAKEREVRVFEVGKVAELPPGSRRIIDAGGKSIGVFNVGGTYFALRNRCPHQGGPLCLGKTTGLVVPRFDGDAQPEREWHRDGEILRCPWHAWEFDLRTGEAIIGEGWRVATYRTRTEPEGPERRTDFSNPPGPVEIYQTSIEAGIVLVEVPA